MRGRAISRRRVLQAGGGLAVTASIGGVADAQGAVSLRAVTAAAPGGRFRRSTYLGLADYTFRAGSATVELVSVDDVPRTGPDPSPRDAERAFSLIFEAPAGTALPEGIHTLSNPETGDVALYLVPVGPERERTYQAIVDRAMRGARAKAPRTRRGALGGRDV